MLPGWVGARARRGGTYWGRRGFTGAGGARSGAYPGRSRPRRCPQGVGRARGRGAARARRSAKIEGGRSASRLNSLRGPGTPPSPAALRASVTASGRSNLARRKISGLGPEGSDRLKAAMASGRAPARAPAAGSTRRLRMQPAPASFGRPPPPRPGTCVQSPRGPGLLPRLGLPPNHRAGWDLSPITARAWSSAQSPRRLGPAPIHRAGRTCIQSPRWPDMHPPTASAGPAFVAKPNERFPWSLSVVYSVSCGPTSGLLAGQWIWRTPRSPPLPAQSSRHPTPRLAQAPPISASSPWQPSNRRAGARRLRKAPRRAAHASGADEPRPIAPPSRPGSQEAPRARRAAQ